MRPAMNTATTRTTTADAPAPACTPESEVRQLLRALLPLADTQLCALHGPDSRHWPRTVVVTAYRRARRLLGLPEMEI